MLIAASADIHSPKYIRLFIDSIRNLPVPDLFLLAEIWYSGELLELLI